MASCYEEESVRNNFHRCRGYLAAMTDGLGAVLLFLSLISLCGLSAFAQSELPPSAVRTIQIPGRRAVDMSAKEDQLAVIARKTPQDGKSENELQIWNLSDLTLLQRREFNYEPVNNPHAAFIRFTSDSTLLVIYFGTGTIHVLRTSDLSELTAIHLDSTETSFNGFEVSPISHLLAIHRTFLREGKAEIFDLDSGTLLRVWSTEGAARGNGSGLTWSSDGRVIAVAVPDGVRCQRGSGTVRVFDIDSPKEPIIFSVSFIPGNIAFGPGDRLYVAMNNCGGYFTYWAPDLPIYDAASGRQVGKIPADKMGIRGSIQISRNQKILLAYANREKTTFEGFEDTLKVASGSWQVRELPQGKLISAFSGGYFDGYRLSSSGRFAWTLPGNQVRIISLIPEAK